LKYVTVAAIAASQSAHLAGSGATVRVARPAEESGRLEVSGQGAGGGVAVHGERDLLGVNREGQERRDEKDRNAMPQHGHL
jgi:hypothetical protein